MREHDQPRLRTRNCLWLGLIVVACAPTALLAQYEEASGAMRSADPIDLAAQRVLVWNEAGERWVVLGGEVAVLQGAEGVRARAAVVRIIEVTDEAGKSFQADVYAEGDVKITGREAAPKLHAPRRAENRQTDPAFTLQAHRPDSVQGTTLGLENPPAERAPSAVLPACPQASAQQPGRTSRVESAGGYRVELDGPARRRPVSGSQVGRRTFLAVVAA